MKRYLFLLPIAAYTLLALLSSPATAQTESPTPTLAPPTVASGATYLVVRRMGRAGVILLYLVLAAMVIVPVLWVVKLFMDAP